MGLNLYATTEALKVVRWKEPWKIGGEEVRGAHRRRLREEAELSKAGSSALQTGAVVIDVLSILRNSATAWDVSSVSCGSGTKPIIDAIFPASKLTVAIGVNAMAGGAFGFLSACNIMRKAASKTHVDYERGNWEGGLNHAGDGAMGASYCAASSGMLIGQAASFAGSASVAAAGGMLATVAGFPMYGMIAAGAGYGLGANYLFYRRLKEVFREGKNKNLAATLFWLQDQVFGACSATGLEKKWDRFAFRTSEACGRFVRERVTPELLRRVEAGERQAIEDAEKIIAEVKRACRKQMARHALFLCIAILGFGAMIAGILFATGPASPLLFAVGSCLWLLTDSKWLQEKWENFWHGKSEIPPAQLPEQVPERKIPFGRFIPRTV